MKLALPVWGNRLSPVFDSARRLLIVQIKNNKVTDRQYKMFDPGHYPDLIQMLHNFKVDALICGAVSKESENNLRSGGIDLIPFVSGRVDKVLESYAENNCISPDFLMPGCKNKHYRHKNRKNFMNPDIKEENTMPGRDGTGPQGQGKPGS